MKTQLLRIANTLVIYSSCIEGNGLFNGKMGIVLYLYHYSRFSGYEQYKDFADKLLDKILDDIANTSNEFEDGLAGIGWAIDHLIKHEFIEGDIDLFENIDVRILSHVNINQYTLFGNGLYLLMRLKHDPADRRYFKDQIIKTSNLWYDKLVQTDIITPMRHLNSVLYFLIRSFESEYIEDERDRLKLLLVGLFDNAFKNNYFDAADLNITKKILYTIDYRCNQSWLTLSGFLENYSGTKNEDRMNTLLKTTLFDMCLFDDYYDDYRTLPGNLISAFITKKQESLTTSDFVMEQGLAGLGYGLCRSMVVNS